MAEATADLRNSMARDELQCSPEQRLSVSEPRGIPRPKGRIVQKLGIRKATLLDLPKLPR